MTPLHFAASSGSAEVVKTLLEAGAHKNATNVSVQREVESVEPVVVRAAPRLLVLPVFS